MSQVTGSVAAITALCFIIGSGPVLEAKVDGSSQSAGDPSTAERVLNPAPKAFSRMIDGRTIGTSVPTSQPPARSTPAAAAIIGARDTQDSTRKATPSIEASQAPAQPPTATAMAPIAPSVAFGAYVHGAPWQIEPLDQFETMTGRRLAIVMWYQTWGSGGASLFDAAMMKRASAHGAMPMLTWVPDGGQVPAFTLREVLAGSHDSYIREFARSAAAWGRPFLLRPLHEMNGDWHAWSPGLNGNTEAEYVAVWRYLHDVFDEEGASNVRWVWAPNTYVARTGISLASVYPGDAFVDWVALDGYNRGTSTDWSRWHSFTAEFGPSYQTLTELTSRPLMIAEMATCEAGGNKADWIRSALGNEIPNDFPRVRAVIWFNQNKECDWRLESSTAGLAAIQSVLQGSNYSGVLP